MGIFATGTVTVARAKAGTLSAHEKTAPRSTLAQSSRKECRLGRWRGAQWIRAVFAGDGRAAALEKLLDANSSAAACNAHKLHGRPSLNVDLAIFCDCDRGVAGTVEGAPGSHSVGIYVANVEKFFLVRPKQIFRFSAHDGKGAQIGVPDVSACATDGVKFISDNSGDQPAFFIVNIRPDLHSIGSSFHRQSLAFAWRLPKVNDGHVGAIRGADRGHGSSEHHQTIRCEIGARIFRRLFVAGLKRSDHFDIRFICEYRRGKIHANTCHESYFR